MFLDETLTKVYVDMGYREKVNNKVMFEICVFELFYYTKTQTFFFKVNLNLTISNKSHSHLLINKLGKLTIIIT